MEFLVDLPWWAWLVVATVLTPVALILLYAFWLNYAPVYTGNDCFLCHDPIFDFQDSARVEVHYQPGTNQAVDFQQQIHTGCWNEHQDKIRDLNAEDTPTSIRIMDM